MKIINDIKKVIKSNKKLYSLVRPIELKYYALRRRIVVAGNITLQYWIKPKIRKITGNREKKDLLRFHNIHKGKRIFVIATGPSLREEDVLKLKDEITISVNGTVTLVDTIGWRPTYYFISDPVTWLREKDMINKSGYKDIFMPFATMKKFESDFSFVPHYYDGYVKIKYILAVLRGKEHTEEMEFSDDLYFKGACILAESVMAQAVQFAAYAGASEIYLLGQDCDYSGPKPYFNDEIGEHAFLPAEQVDRAIRSIFDFYKVARQHCEAHHIKLYNATRGGRLEELERVDFDKVIV